MDTKEEIEWRSKLAVLIRATVLVIYVSSEQEFRVMGRLRYNDGYTSFKEPYSIRIGTRSTCKVEFFLRDIDYIIENRIYLK